MKNHSECFLSSLTRRTILRLGYSKLLPFIHSSSALPNLAYKVSCGDWGDLFKDVGTYSKPDYQPRSQDPIDPITHTLFHVLSVCISSSSQRSLPSGSRLSSAIYNCCIPPSIFALLCPSSARHPSPHIHSKACPLAHPSVAGLEMRSRARLFRQFGKLIRTREFGQTPSL